jgi:hypothetical protein
MNFLKNPVPPPFFLGKKIPRNSKKFQEIPMSQTDSVSKNVGKKFIETIIWYGRGWKK